MHRAGSILGAETLVSGTTIGAGILALPTATTPVGFLPSSIRSGVAWICMTISGLLIAELSINRIGETGKVGVGLLDLYKTSLGNGLRWVRSSAYFFLHYAVMVAYISQSGENLGSLLSGIGLESVSSVAGVDQLLFAGTIGCLLYFSKLLVAGVVASFLDIIAAGAGSGDFSSLVALGNQDPDLVVDVLTICFLSMVYHNVVPTVVTQLEGDKTKITKALIGGTRLLMFLAWNAIILGNIVDIPGGLESGTDPIGVLQNEGIGGENLG